jgi:hypothetical protein
MIAERKNPSKARKARFAKMVEQNHVRRATKAAVDTAQDGLAVDAPSNSKGSLVLVPNEKGSGVKAFIEVDGKVREVQTGAEATALLGLNNNSAASREVAELLNASRKRSWRAKSPAKNLDSAGFQKRLDDVIQSADAHRKAPGFRELVLGLRDIVSR